MAIHLEMTFQASPQQVYQFLVNGANLGEATGLPGMGGGATGAYFSLFDGWISGRQIELVRGERIVQAWRMVNWEPAVYSVVQFTLAADSAGTKMTVDQDGVSDDDYEHVSTNWGGFYFDPIGGHFTAVAA